jgi:kinesin family protein 2/24
MRSNINTNPNQTRQPTKKLSIAEDMERLKQRREDRKKKLEEKNEAKIEASNDVGVTKVDADYENLILQKKKNIDYRLTQKHTRSDNSKIFVCVRKRPISTKELQSGEIDCVSSLNPRLLIHECKIKIDGITKYIEDHEFYFDNVFNEKEATEDLYTFSIEPTISLIMNRGIVTCFAYGQTGSGKTYTMKGIQNLAIDSIFNNAQKNKLNLEFYISFYEIYAGRLYDLLNDKNKLSVLEDKNQRVQIYGLEERNVRTPEEMRDVIDLANSIRTTHNTVTNETSSRSHAICNIVIKERESEEIYGKLTLVDLAGSERAQETQSNEKSRRAEGAEINKSLLALKECIRALDSRKSGNSEQHVPFRASKLTLVLRDSFIP